MQFIGPLLYDLIDLHAADADVRLCAIGDYRDFFKTLIVKIESRGAAATAGPIQVEAVDVVNGLARGAAMNLRAGLLETLIAADIEHRRSKTRQLLQCGP